MRGLQSILSLSRNKFNNIRFYFIITRLKITLTWHFLRIFEKKNNLRIIHPPLLVAYSSGPSELLLYDQVYSTGVGLTSVVVLHLGSYQGS